MVKVNERVFDSPLFTLASVSTELLEVAALETTSPSTQGKGSKNEFPTLILRHQLER